jgi:hypothetical protein
MLHVSALRRILKTSINSKVPLSELGIHMDCPQAVFLEY